MFWESTDLCILTSFLSRLGGTTRIHVNTLEYSRSQYVRSFSRAPFGFKNEFFVNSPSFLEKTHVKEGPLKKCLSFLKESHVKMLSLKRIVFNSVFHYEIY